MKKIFAFILVICMCAASIVSFSSCGDKKEDEGIATEEGTKEFVSENLIKKVRLLKTREEVHNLLNAEFFRHDTKYGRFELYKISDKRMASVSYSEEKKDPTGMSDTVSSVEIVDTVDVALIDQIKEGYTYDKITEIFGGIKGEMKTSRYWGLYRYVLNDGRLLYINYDGQAFATSIYIENEKGECTYPHLPQQESYSSKNADEFRQYLIDNYKDKASEIAVPVLASDEFRLYAASDVSQCFFYTFVPAEADEHSDEFVKGLLSVEIWKIDLMYKDLVNYYKSEERNEVIECKDGVIFVKNCGRFIFNNNGRALVVDIPLTLREDFSYSEDYSGTPITSLEDLNKYITIEYFDLNSTENSSN